jgi:Universal stress protein family
MTPVDLTVAIVAVLAGVAGTLAYVRTRRPPPLAGGAPAPAPTARVLFPFVGGELSERALQAALRLARADGATLVPAYLATVPQALPLDAPLPRTCDVAFTVFEAIEQRAARAGVPVDARVARGRSPRHALRELMRDVPHDRIVVAAALGTRHDGFAVEDIAWLLRNASGEVIVLRPDPGSVEEDPRATAMPATVAHA